MSHGDTMITLETTISRNNTHVVATKIDEEVVILNSHSGNYYGLDEVGARIWEIMEKPCAISKILNTLLDEYDVERQQCEHDLLLLIDALDTRGLVNVL